MNTKEQVSGKRVNKNTGFSNKIKVITAGILTTLGTISSQAKAAEPTIMDSEEAMTEMMFDNDNLPGNLIVAPNSPVFDNCHIDTCGTFIVNQTDLQQHPAGIIINLLLEDLEELYTNTPIVVNFTYNGSGTLCAPGATCYSGTFPIFTYTGNSWVHNFGSWSGPGIGFGLRGKSDPRITTNNNTLKARDLPNGTAEIASNGTVTIKASKIFNGAKLVVNGNTYSTGLPANMLPQNQDGSWQITLTPQNLGLVNGGDEVVCLINGRTHTGGDWISGVSFTVKLQNTLNQPTISILPAGWTNQDKTATLTFTQPVKPVPQGAWQGLGAPNPAGYWTQWQKTYTQNATETVNFQNVAVNTVSVQMTITGIDKIAPVINNIAHTPTTPTNQPVTITVSASDAGGSGIKEYAMNGGAYQTSNQFTVSANGTYNFTAKDYAGNVSNSSAYTVSNIDIIPPTGYFTHTTEWTNLPRTWTATFSETVNKPNGWNGPATGTTFTKEILANGQVVATTTDLAGNQGTITGMEDHIDTTPPTIANTTQNPTTPTNGQITITVTASDNSGGSGIVGYAMNSGEYQSSNQFTVLENGTYSITAKDLVGNVSTPKVHTVSNIDRIPPIATLTPNGTQWTNTDRTWTAAFNEQVHKPDGWNGAATGTTFTKPVSENGEVTVSTTDLAGNQGTATGTETHIDKILPLIGNITHTPIVATTEPVTITVSASDDLSGIAGYSINGGSYQSDNEFTVAENGTYTISVIDSAGNYVVTTHKVENITVGIKEIENKNLNIYPNPANGELRIELRVEPAMTMGQARNDNELKIESVEIFDVYGRSILNSQFSILNSIDVSHLPSGVYLVRIYTESGCVDRKLVKE